MVFGQTFKFGFLGATLLLSSLATADSVFVIVHPDNPTQTLKREQLKEFLLKKVSTWNNNEKIRFLLPVISSTTFTRLIENICDMTPDQWDSYWMRQEIHGDHPPPTVNDELVILRNVTKDVSAMGAVSAKMLKGEIRNKLRIVFTID